MGRLSFFLMFFLVACALLLVGSQHRARTLFIALERAQEQTRQLDVAWRQLQLEQTQYAKHALIDQVARRDLSMLAVTPAQTLYVAQSDAKQHTESKIVGSASAVAVNNGGLMQADEKTGSAQSRGMP